MPVYVFTEGRSLALHWSVIAISIAGVVIGTVAGAHFLRRVPDRAFRTVVAFLLLGLGTWMLVHG
jgi:uncharacterized membrane protein YfcA